MTGRTFEVSDFEIEEGERELASTADFKDPNSSPIEVGGYDIAFSFTCPGEMDDRTYNEISHCEKLEADDGEKRWTLWPEPGWNAARLVRGAAEPKK